MGMSETLYALGITTALVIGTWLAIVLGGVKGLRSYRGSVLYFLLIITWAIGWTLAHFYIPLGLLGLIVGQVAVFTVVAKQSLFKSLATSVLYTFAVIAIHLGLVIILFGVK